jgi:hypothetical protein
VVVSSGSYSASDEIVITVNSVQADAGANVEITEGESVKLTASGGDSYEWSTGEKTKSIVVNPLETSVYGVVVSRNGCVSSDQVKVTVIPKQPDTPVVIADAGEDQTMCVGEQVTLTGKGGESFLWSTGETTRSIQVSPDRTTTYSVQARVGNQTDTDEVVVTVETCSSDNGSDQSVEEDVSEESVVETVDPENQLESMNVYPNPASGIINVNLTNMEDDVNLDLISMNGSVVYSDIMNVDHSNSFKQLDLRSIEKGVYFVRVYNANQNLVKKLIMI